MLSIHLRNIQSINNKFLKLTVLLYSDLISTSVLCFPEYWLNEEYIKLVSIDKFKTVRNFSKTTSDNAGYYIYVSHHLHTKEVKCLQEISNEKDFEMTAI